MYCNCKNWTVTIFVIYDQSPVDIALGLFSKQNMNKRFFQVNQQDWIKVQKTRKNTQNRASNSLSDVLFSSLPESSDRPSNFLLLSWKVNATLSFKTRWCSYCSCTQKEPDKKTNASEYKILVHQGWPALTTCFFTGKMLDWYRGAVVRTCERKLQGNLLCK